jgi:Family of unknown function (DUF6011)
MKPPILIPPIPALAELRDAVLEHSEKRKPKWGFRVADDLVMELQAQPVSLVSPALAAKGLKQAILRFEGLAIMAEGAGEAMLRKLPSRVPFWRQTFSLSEFDDDRGRWQLTFLRWIRCHGCDQAGTDRLDERILAAFQNGFFDHLTPKAMLRPACMICGKGLTDPASMARWIGPECAATSSLRVFRAAEERLPLEAIAS